MKLLITGSRKCIESDYVKFEEFLNNLIVDKDLDVTEMIHGGAKGADQFADRWAKARMIPVSVCNRAPLVKNDVMLELCTACVAIFKEVKTGRQYICIEKDEKYYNLGYQRVQEYQHSLVS